METCNTLGNRRAKRPHYLSTRTAKMEASGTREKGTDTNTEIKPSKGKNIRAQPVYGHRLFSLSLLAGQASSVAPTPAVVLCGLVKPSSICSAHPLLFPLVNEAQVMLMGSDLPLIICTVPHFFVPTPPQEAIQSSLTFYPVTSLLQKAKRKLCCLHFELSVQRHRGTDRATRSYESQTL